MGSNAFPLFTLLSVSLVRVYRVFKISFVERIEKQHSEHFGMYFLYEKLMAPLCASNRLKVFKFKLICNPLAVPCSF